MGIDFSEQDIQSENVSDNEILLPEDIEDAETNEDICGENFHMNWRGDYKTACELLADKQYEKALELFSKETVKGNVPAIYSVAKMYQRGLLGEENIPKAQEYFAQTLKGFLALELSADKMQPYIWYHLGRLYNFGYGTQQNYTEAFKWFQKVAEADNKYAQYSLGRMLLKGFGCEADPQQAVDLFRKSAEKNNASMGRYL